mmetsp:Transcript_19932/g.37217  ORF Transcript_19932/g.37217 Transcript_19932/m.37217 type:complete len:86 (+) Transcript_19932:557-814(+)
MDHLYNQICPCRLSSSVQMTLNAFCNLDLEATKTVPCATMEYARLNIVLMKKIAVQWILQQLILSVLKPAVMMKDASQMVKEVAS